MNSDRHSRVSAIFAAARRLQSDELDDYLDVACAGDDELRGLVTSLLSKDSDLARELGTEVVRADVVDLAADSLAGRPGPEIPAVIGRYHILGVIGEGGMGTVFEARQEEPRRTVALKVIRQGVAAPSLLRRFKHEAHVLGQLQHPGIAQIHEAGIADFGRPGAPPHPFFAMELIRGRSLLEHVNENGLGTRQRLDLLVKICDAVEHAHQKGVIHRDLKPGNILVDESDQPKILDFGVARATDADIQLTTMRTDLGQLIGTIPYMSPEQVGADPLSVDARSDVYALGVITYEMLTGRMPYDVERMSIPEAMLVIREAEPARLSSINPVFRGDVETIVAKALEKEKERRYGSAAEFAADIRRYLRDEPIIARPPTTLYQLGKFAKRNRGFVAGTALAFLLLIAGTVTTSMFALRASRERRIAQENEQMAERNEERALESELLARRATYRSSISAAHSAIRLLDGRAANEALESAPAEFRNWEWRHLKSQLDQCFAVVQANPKYDASIAVSPDGRYFASETSDQTVGLWDAADVRLVASLDAGRSLGAARSGLHERYLRFSPRGRFLAATVKDPPGVVIWDTRTPETDATVRKPAGWWRALAFSNDDALLAMADSNEAIVLLDPATGHVITKLTTPKRPLRRLDFAPSGRMLVATVEPVRRTQETYIFDINTGGISSIIEDPSEVRSIDFNKDETRLLRTSFDLFNPDFPRGAVAARSFDVADGRVVDTVLFEGAKNYSAVNRTIGRLAARIYGPRRLALYDLQSGARLATISGHYRAIEDFSFIEAPGLLATASLDGTARLWNARDGSLVRGLLGHQPGFMKLDHDGYGLLASRSEDGQIRLWDLRDGDSGNVLRAHTSFVYSVAYSPDGSMLATGTFNDGQVCYWDPAVGARLGTLPHERNAYALAFSADSRQLITLAEEDVRIYEVSSGREIARSVVPTLSIVMSVSRTDDRIAVAGPNGATIFHGDRDDRRKNIDGKFSDVAISPDGKLLILAGEDGTLTVWDMQMEAPATSLTAQSAMPVVEWSSNGDRLAVGSGDGAIHVFDARSLDRIAELTGHSSRIYDLAFMIDGTRLVSASNDNTIRIWDTIHYEPIVALRGHESYVYRLAISPDESQIASASGDLTVRLWNTIPASERGRPSRADAGQTPP